MDVPAAAAGPWIALGAVAGLLIAALVVGGVLLARRPSTHEPVEPPSPAGSYRHDDLPGFLDSPPGTRDAVAPRTGWTSLAPVPREAPVARDAGGHETTRLLAAMVLAALVLVGGAAAVAAATGDAGSTTERSSRPPADGTSDEELTADLSFGGVVLQRRAVGVTVTYPRVHVMHDPDGETGTRVELPTWNCLTDTAPDDPIATGCARSLTEVAELTTPELTVSDEGGLRLSGRFPTAVQPHGSSPAQTGRSYEIVVIVSESRAEGTLRLGPERVGTTEVDVLRHEG